MPLPPAIKYLGEAAVMLYLGLKALRMSFRFSRDLAGSPPESDGSRRSRLALDELQADLLAAKRAAGSAVMDDADRQALERMRAAARPETVIRTGVHCPGCRTELGTDGQPIGFLIACPSCGKPLTVRVAEHGFVVQLREG